MKIATLNTWKNDGDYPQRLKAMIQMLREVDADIVLLQESLIAESLQLNTGRSLAYALNINHYEAPSRAKKRFFDGVPHLSSSGLSILSRLPIRHHRYFQLPSTEKGGERICQWVTLQYEGRNLCLGNLHLSHVRSEFGIKCDQWHESLRYCFEHWKPDFALIGGDMNTDLDGADAAKLFTFPNISVVDAFQAVKGQSTESTHPVPPREDRPGRRIDTVFSLFPEGESPAMVPISAEVLGKTTSEGTYPSDHALVSFDFSTT
jgi:endonuclease/exonuclease/phosphatase family metal-dependent hydrolase